MLESVIYMAKVKGKKRLTKVGLIVLVIIPLLVICGVVGIGYMHSKDNKSLNNNSNPTSPTSANESNNSSENNEEPQVIETSTVIRTKVGESVDLVSALAGEDPNKGTVEGEYDFNKSGVYKLRYVTTDSNNKKTIQGFTLKVYMDGINLDLSKLTPGNYKTFTTSKGYEGIVLNDVTYIEGFIIANKTYTVPKDYGTGLEKETQAAFDKMVAGAKKDNINVNIQSGFRSYETQSRIYNRHVTTYSQAEADTYSARPGHSEHQTGTAMDLNWIKEALENRADGKWLFANAYKYGFVLRYPKGKDNETGYMYEPWHYRYVGTELAKILYNDGDWITLESYFGITSKYND